MIIGGLRKFFPGLRIVGEETVDYKGEISVDYESLRLDSYPENPKFKDLLIPIDELCVWIDPIDCTKGFIRKEMHYVTTLIGMSRNQSAYLGIIGVPYKQIKNETIYRP
jgi:3'(2'), 5'-bisphosphate nucleotidase